MMAIENLQSKEREAAFSIARFCKYFLGRGPEDVSLSIVDDNLLLVKLKGITSEAQKRMYHTHHSSLVQDYLRVLIEEHLLVEVVNIIENIFETGVKKSITGFDLELDLVILIFMIEGRKD